MNLYDSRRHNYRCHTRLFGISSRAGQELFRYRFQKLTAYLKISFLIHLPYGYLLGKPVFVCKPYFKEFFGIVCRGIINIQPAFVRVKSYTVITAVQIKNGSVVRCDLSLALSPCVRF